MNSDPESPTKEGMKLIPAVYDDAARPAMREVGRTLAGVVRIALSPANFVIWSFEEAVKFAEDRLNDILERRRVPPERVCSPAAEVAGPVFAALRIASQSEDLRNLYLELLATAMDRDSAASAHPSFAEIIRQLTPDEARVIRLFVNVEASGEPSGFPMVDVIAHLSGGEKGFVYLLSGFTLLGTDAGCDHDLPTSSVINLERLGLVRIRRDERLASDEDYSPLLTHPIVEDARQLAESRPGATAETCYGLVAVTDFGLNFAYACTGERECIGVPPRTAVSPTR